MNSENSLLKGPPSQAVEVSLNESEITLRHSMLLQLAVFAAVTMLLLILAPEVPVSLRLLYIAGVLLTLRRFGGLVVLLTVQTDLVLRERQTATPLISLSTFVFVLLTVGVMMMVYRHRLLLQRLSSVSVLHFARSLLAGNAGEHDNGGSAVPVWRPLRIVRSATAGLLTLSLCAVGAGMLLSLLPGNRQFTEILRKLIGADPRLLTGSLLIAGVIAVWVVVSELAWRQLSPAQARVYLRSVFLKTHYGDLKMIVMRRLRERRKQAMAAPVRNEGKKNS